MLIQRRKTIILCVAVCGVGDGSAGGEVVYPVELGLFRARVEAAEEEVYGVWGSRAEGFGEFAADEGGDFVGGEVGGVAHAVELDVGLDVFCELDWKM